MKRCLACEARFESEDWMCPKCSFRPTLHDGTFQFAEDASDGGFKPEYFPRLAAIEPTRISTFALKSLSRARAAIPMRCGTAANEALYTLP